MNLEFYKCDECNTVFEISSGDSCTKCSGTNLNRITPNSIDADQEKHVPVISYTDEGVTVRVGAVPHPMEEAHFIQWIEIYYADRRERKFLKPSEKPEASFRVASKDIKAVVYCNLHGLWVSNEK